MLPGIDYALREQNQSIFDDPAINAAEITFERAHDPLRVHRYIGEPVFDYVSVHALKLSVARPDPPREDYLATLKSIAVENGAATVSDHLGFTRNGNNGVESGHFAPPLFNVAALDCTCRNIDVIQNYMGDLQFYVENIAYLFRFESTMSESEFIARMLQRTECGWLLDVTSVYANAVNFGFDPHQFIDRIMPAARSVQMHLAGRMHDNKMKNTLTAIRLRFLMLSGRCTNMLCDERSTKSTRSLSRGIRIFRMNPAGEMKFAGAAKSQKKNAFPVHPTASRKCGRPDLFLVNSHDDCVTLQRQERVNTAAPPGIIGSCAAAVSNNATATVPGDCGNTGGSSLFLSVAGR